MRLLIPLKREVLLAELRGVQLIALVPVADIVGPQVDAVDAVAAAACQMTAAERPLSDRAVLVVLRKTVLAEKRRAAARRTIEKDAAARLDFSMKPPVRHRRGLRFGERRRHGRRRGRPNGQPLRKSRQSIGPCIGAGRRSPFTAPLLGQCASRNQRCATQPHTGHKCWNQSGLVCHCPRPAPNQLSLLRRTPG